MYENDLLYQFRFLNMTMSKPIQIAGQGRTTSNSWSWLLRGVLTQHQRFGMAAQFMFRRRNWYYLQNNGKKNRSERCILY
ncbi:hypothetical protein GZ77_13560 [Endozoicomonas montiporae]|uniref:Uncharacterized protein n=2 Tax=Endozoicomonas montiporae TaxID=1027273 RepID=A0A081N4N4_9GAMM|nr:hypothetical protein EZMO1_3762 [Endozoicomonas montiporae CL-33]KEQ13407.1 hypothetical protein GZ77_13560 [Endozoicomonas montiporae]